MADYADRWISCTSKGIEVRGYYFPWGSKHIAWGALKGVRRVTLGPLRGKARIWGTGNFRYWASLDPKRPTKSTAFLLDVGKAVKPFITPDDPDGFAVSLAEHAPSISVVDGGNGPFV